MHFNTVRLTPKRSGQRTRRPNGTMIVLVSFLALIFLSLLGFFSFEVGRATLAQQQLQNAVDAAALAAVATLASQDNANPSVAHNDAIQTALNLFKQNGIMGTPLTNTTLMSTPSNTPPAGHATLYFEFVNPITHTVEPITSPNAKIVRLYGDFSLLPAFGRFLGLGQFTVHCISHAAVPMLDLVLCFDISGSMDDQTPVTLIKRKWDASLGKIVYELPPCTISTNGKIFNIMQPGPNGTSLNATPPQVLSMAYAWDYLYFSEVLAAYYGIPGLRSGGVYPEAGCPPGNYPPGTAFPFDGWQVFTDLVANIDNNDTFGGLSAGGYNFPDVATLVEASRGNLENSTVFNSSMACTAVSVTPQVGYQSKYFELAKAVEQPLNSAKIAAVDFMDIINSDTDAHLGFVAFDHGIGASATDTELRYDIDDDEFPSMPPYGAQVAYPRPLVPLDPGTSNGFTTVTTAIKACVPIGPTNIGAAVQAAVQELTTHKRTGAMRAIVLFTDGQATWGNPLDPDPSMNARKAALLARNAGIPVYTIGLAQDPSVVVGETTMLNDTNQNPTTGGIAAISAHGATFTLVTDVAQLRAAFQKVARHLVGIVVGG